MIFFLTIRLESRAPSQKSRQKTTSTEGSPTAKAKPCLALREQRSEEISSRSLGSLVNPENADERKRSRTSFQATGAIRQENVPQASRKLVQEDQNQTEHVMRGNIPTPQAQGNLVRHHQN